MAVPRCAQLVPYGLLGMNAGMGESPSLLHFRRGLFASVRHWAEFCAEIAPNGRFWMPIGPYPANRTVAGWKGLRELSRRP